MTEPNFVTLSAQGKSLSGITNSVQARDFQPFFVDEQEQIGGGNAGPNPLEYFLGALSACTSIMTTYVAKDLGFSYENIEKRCPIYNLLKDAGVEVITNWDRR